MNKLFAGISVILFSTTVTKCTYTYEEIKPTPEDMGQWDGNYIYKGNIRCKTTGEDESILIEQITMDNVVYEIDYVNDYFYKEDHIFMLLEDTEYEEDNYTIKNRHSFFVDYSIEDKDYEIIYSLFDETASLNYFYNFDNYSFIRIDKPFASIIKFDYLTNKIDFMNEDLYDLYGYCFVENNILIAYKDNKVKYTYCDDINLIDIKTVEYADTHNYVYSIVDDNYLCIKYTEGVYNSAVDSYVYYSALEVYDLTKNKHSVVFDLSEQIELNYITQDYFVKGKTTSYEYVSSLRNLQSHKHEVLSANLLTHNSLCKIDYETATYTEVYKFKDEDIDFSNGYIEDDKFYISSKRIRKGFQLRPGGYKHKEYILDLNKLKLRKKEFENKKKNTVVDKNDSIIYGGYEYYLTSTRYGPILGSHEAFFLKRKNLTTNEEKVMQFFTDDIEHDYGTDGKIIVGTRFSNLLWEDLSYDFNKDIIYITNM